MRMSGYTSAEVQPFYRVLDRIVVEVTERELRLPIDELIHRLFKAAESGERDPGQLTHCSVGLQSR
jgi:hypothetical protein